MNVTLPPIGRSGWRWVSNSLPALGIAQAFALVTAARNSIQPGKGTDPRLVRALLRERDMPDGWSTVPYDEWPRWRDGPARSCADGTVFRRG